MLSEGSSAVATLHQSLVKLRLELSKRDEKIEQLEKRLRYLTDANHRSLDEEQSIKIFEEFDKDEQSRSDTSYDHEKNTPSKVTQDPVMEFVMSEEEKEDDRDMVKIPKSTKTHQLVMNEHILLHSPPSDLKPILRNMPISPSRTSSNGSQTDITALEPRMMNGRPWSSEPYLSSPNDKLGVISTFHSTLSLRSQTPKAPFVKEHTVAIAALSPTNQTNDCSKISEESVDELLVEARAFINIAEHKLMDLNDWSLIDEAKGRFFQEMKNFRTASPDCQLWQSHHLISHEKSNLILKTVDNWSLLKYAVPNNA